MDLCGQVGTVRGERVASIQEGYLVWEGIKALASPLFPTPFASLCNWSSLLNIVPTKNILDWMSFQNK